jgi:hypothetical protein
MDQTGATQHILLLVYSLSRAIGQYTIILYPALSADEVRMENLENCDVWVGDGAGMLVSSAVVPFTPWLNDMCAR